MGHLPSRSSFPGTHCVGVGLIRLFLNPPVRTPLAHEVAVSRLLLPCMVSWGSGAIFTVPIATPTLPRTCMPPYSKRTRACVCVCVEINVGLANRLLVAPVLLVLINCGPFHGVPPGDRTARHRRPHVVIGVSPSSRPPRAARLRAVQVLRHHLAGTYRLALVPSQCAGAHLDALPCVRAGERAVQRPSQDGGRAVRPLRRHPLRQRGFSPSTAAAVRRAASAGQPFASQVAFDGHHIGAGHCTHASFQLQLFQTDGWNRSWALIRRRENGRTTAAAPATTTMTMGRGRSRRRVPLPSTNVDKLTRLFLCTGRQIIMVYAKHMLLLQRR